MKQMLAGYNTDYENWDPSLFPFKVEIDNTKKKKKFKKNVILITK